MKQFRYILLLVFLGFFGKPSECTAFDLKLNKGFNENRSLTLKKSTVVKVRTSKVTRRKGPKKPKGIKVIVPNVSTLVFGKFCHYCDFTVPEVKGDYSLLLYYSHSERGPPFCPQTA